MSKIIFSPSARLDLKQVNSYLAGKNPQAARILKEKRLFVTLYAKSTYKMPR